MSTRNAGIEDRGPAVFAVTTATLALATAFVVARLICRKFVVRNISRDDQIIVLAWFLAAGLSITIDLGTSKGLGRHDRDIAAADWGALRRCQYAFSVLYNPALMATKTSILIFYLRLAKNTQKVLRLASWATLVVVNLAGTVLTFMNIFQCRPINAAWNPWESGARCIPLLTEFICAAPVNIVTDLAILALPIPVLTGMRLPPRQKTILVLTFGLGAFVTIVDVVRIYYLQQAISAVPTSVSQDPDSRFGGQREFAFNASLSLMWSAVEVNVGMMCACIPTLKPLIIKILPAMLIDPDGSGLSKEIDREGFGFPVSPPTSGMARGGSSPGGLQLPAPSRLSRARMHRTSRVGSNGEYFSHALDFQHYPDLETPQPPAPLGSHEPERVDTMTALTESTSAHSRQENAVYFGFVNMAKPKSMLRCSVSESWKYCTAVTVLFLLWGMSYGLLNNLNSAVAYVSGMSYAQTLGLTSAYFGGGYFFGPLLVGEWILRRDEHHRTPGKNRKGQEGIGGFKVTFIVGLCFYGIGTIIFWPSAVTNSFGGFMLSNFVVGFGLSILETGANAFLILCGPERHADTRLMLAQGVQGVGTVVAGVLGQRVFFRNLHPSDEITSMRLIDVQWTYLAVTLVCVILALFFYYMPLPEVGDAELDRASRRLPADPRRRSVGGLQLRTWALILAVVGQWTYMAAQECASIFARRLMLSLVPGLEADAARFDTPYAFSEAVDKPAGLSVSAPAYILIAQSAFALSRFAVAWLLHASLSDPRLPRPRTILTACIALSSGFALMSVLFRPSNPNLAAIPLVLLYTTEGPCWPLIFSLGLRGQGRRTKRAAAFITMGGSGPAFFPFVMFAIMEAGGSVRTAWVVVAVLQCVAFVYPAFLSISRDARRMVDPVVGGVGADSGGSGSGSGSGEGSGSGSGDAAGEEEPPVEEVIAKRRARASEGAMGKRLSGYFGARREAAGALEKVEGSAADDSREESQDKARP